MSGHRKWSELVERNAGRTAYEAYAGVREWKTFDGGDMLIWSKLAPAIQHAWHVATMAVIEAYERARNIEDTADE